MSEEKEWIVKCAFLESRLKDAEKDLEIEKIINQARFNEKQSLLVRLSQAEDDMDKLKALNGTYRMLYEARLEKYSHLMDAAGKLEMALGEAFTALNSIDCYGKVMDNIQAVRAEWDGIKKEGGK